MHLLLIAEAVTLAHVGRTLALARRLCDFGQEVSVAVAGTSVTWRAPFSVEATTGIGSNAFTSAIKAGRPVLHLALLKQLADADLELLRKHSPDLVLGDFRLSLSVSARIFGVPYSTLTNAYWSEACTLPMPMPVLPLSRALPLPVARLLFDLGKRFVLPQHTAPMNKVRAEFGLPSLGSSLHRVYTDADHVLFADLPGMFPMRDEPAHHHYLGPILWSPPTELPDWWDDATLPEPSAYVTVGSSGEPLTLRRIVEALLAMNVSVLAATAGGSALDGLAHPRLRFAPYLPGDAAASRVNFVVCNGGSMGCQQAFAADRPVLGVCGNMDQFLNMAGVELAGAGLTMRADRVSAKAVRQMVTRLLEDRSFSAAAARLGERIRASDPGQVLFDLLPTLAARH